MLGERCYTTTKGVRIGIAHVPKQIYRDGGYDSDWIQCKILGQPIPQQPKPRKRGLFSIWRQK